MNKTDARNATIELVWEALLGTGPLSGTIDSFDADTGIVTCRVMYATTSGIPLKVDVGHLFHLGLPVPTPYEPANHQPATSLVGPNVYSALYGQGIGFTGESKSVHLTELPDSEGAFLHSLDEPRWNRDENGIFWPVAPLSDSVKRHVMLEWVHQLAISQEMLAGEILEAIQGAEVLPAATYDEIVRASEWHSRAAADLDEIAEIIAEYDRQLAFGGERPIVGMKDRDPRVLSGSGRPSDGGPMSVTTVADPSWCGQLWGHNAALDARTIAGLDTGSVYRRRMTALSNVLSAAFSVESNGQGLEFVIEYDGGTHVFTSRAFDRWDNAVHPGMINDAIAEAANAAIAAGAR